MMENEGFEAHAFGEGESRKLDWVPPSDEPMQIEGDNNTTPSPMIEQITDIGGEPEPDSTDAGEDAKKAIAALLVWKSSHPSYDDRDIGELALHASASPGEKQVFYVP